jgi:hypothetical protein
MLEDIIPVLAILMIFGIPIIAILTSHQQKMAKLFAENHQIANLPNPETQALRAEVRELKELVLQQTIALDNLHRPLPTDADVQRRVEV